jgi:hypothetical protein
MYKTKFQKILQYVILLAIIIYAVISIVVNDKEIQAMLNAVPLKNIIDDEEVLLSSNSQQIFFLETHLEGRRSLLNARQACRYEH